jgi:hypothetical protein
MPISKIKTHGIEAESVTSQEIAANAVNHSELADNIEIAGTQAARMPVGTSAERTSAKTGDIRFNSTIELMEYYDGNVWKGIDSPPIITSVTGLVNEDDDSTITINGSNFSTGVTVQFINNSNGAVVKSAAVVTRVSSNQLTATTGNNSANMTAGTVLDIKVTNASSLAATLTNAMTVSSDPTFSYPAASTNIYTYPTNTDVSGQEHITLKAIDTSVTESNVDDFFEDVVMLLQPEAGDTTLPNKSDASFTIETIGNFGVSSAIADPFGGSLPLLYTSNQSTDSHARLDSCMRDVFKSSQFTIEMFVYPESTAQRVFAINEMENAGTNIPEGWNNFVIWNQSGVSNFQGSLENGNSISNCALNQNAWNHIVMQFDGNELSFWTNGTKRDSKSAKRIQGSIERLRNVSTETPTSNITSSGGSYPWIKMTLGAEWDGHDTSPNDHGRHYYTGVRITKNVARYTGSTYTVPTAPYPTSGATKDNNITYSVTSGTLPTGLSISGDNIVGDGADVSADTTNAITVTAQKGSDTNATVTRSFNIIRNKGQWGKHPDTPFNGSMQDLIDDLGFTPWSGDFYFHSTGMGINNSSGQKVAGFYYDSTNNGLTIKIAGSNISYRHVGAAGHHVAWQGNYYISNTALRTKHAHGDHTASNLIENSDGTFQNTSEGNGPNTGAITWYYNIGVPYRYAMVEPTWRSVGSHTSGLNNSDWSANDDYANTFTEGSFNTVYGDRPFDIMGSTSTANTYRGINGNTDTAGGRLQSGGWTAAEAGDVTRTYKTNMLDGGAGTASTKIGHGIAGGANEYYRLQSATWWIR